MSVRLKKNDRVRVISGKDKGKEGKVLRRVPERALLLMAFFLGGPGICLGMYAFRHKTKHWYFVIGFWALAVLQLSALGWLAYRYL